VAHRSGAARIVEEPPGEPSEDSPRQRGLGSRAARLQTPADQPEVKEWALSNESNPSTDASDGLLCDTGRYRKSSTSDVSPENDDRSKLE
jgi:hypothetical protein